MEHAKCYVVDVRKLRKDVTSKLLSRGTVVKTAGLTLVLLTGLEVTTLAASTGIDAGANQLYKKLLNIAKWVIVFKGGMDTVKDVTDGDLHGARKHFLGYLVTYAILWALPWGMGEVDKMFKDMEASGT